MREIRSLNMRKVTEVNLLLPILTLSIITTLSITSNVSAVSLPTGVWNTRISEIPGPDISTQLTINPFSGKGAWTGSLGWCPSCLYVSPVTGYYNETTGEVSFSFGEIVFGGFIIDSFFDGHLMYDVTQHPTQYYLDGSYVVNPWIMHHIEGGWVACNGIISNIYCQ
jgi:hypothetical protein